MAGKSDEATGWSETLRTRLCEKLDTLLDRFLESDDPAEKAQIEKDARTCGVFARSGRAIETMVPDRSAPKPADDAAANDDEVSMHDGIPDDPEEIQAALAARLDRFAELRELKRRAGEADRGDAGPGEGGSAEAAERASGRSRGPSGPG